MEAVVVPDLPLAREVFILADNDAHARGLAAAQALARRLVREGRVVRVALPDAVDTDWADVFAEAPHVA
jgi:putative DNA primase/helicase